MSERKSGNRHLHSAKTGKNDEFYTQLSDIEKELGYYKEHFKGKIVFCNCDDPEESYFWHYFAEAFGFLGLRKLIATHYEDDKPSYKLEIITDMNGDGKINKKDTIRTPLKQNGDFRSPECIEILEKVDIVVTNPPFSLFREYVGKLMEYGKKFVIIGNLNAITYKEIFPYIKRDKIWLGNTFPKEFIEPNGGLKKFGNINWFTNLEIGKRSEDLLLYKKYSPKEYVKYDNYNAINVDKVKDIPVDYPGVIGVPITFLDKHNPEQFEILGTSDNGLVDNELKITPGLTAKFVDDYYKAGGTGTYREGNPTAGYYHNGIATMAYKRIFIRNKKLNF